MHKFPKVYYTFSTDYCNFYPVILQQTGRARDAFETDDSRVYYFVSLKFVCRFLSAVVFAAIFTTLSDNVFCVEGNKMRIII